MHRTARQIELLIEHISIFFLFQGLSETSLKFIRTSHAPVGASGVTSGCTIEEDRKIFDTRDHNIHRHPHRWPPRTSPEGI
jgi:hypothetical protein